jgi:hypothetical protein
MLFFSFFFFLAHPLWTSVISRDNLSHLVEPETFTGPEACILSSARAKTIECNERVSQQTITITNQKSSGQKKPSSTGKKKKKKHQLHLLPLFILFPFFTFIKYTLLILPLSSIQSPLERLPSPSHIHQRRTLLIPNHLSFMHLLHESLT